MISGYTYTKSWFDFALEKSKKVRPIHGILYLWAVEKCNRLCWVNEFQFPTDEACQACGCADRETVGKALKDLQDWGFIKITQESRNRFTAKYISLLLPKKSGAISGSTEVDTEKIGSYSEAIPAATPTNIKPINNKTLNLKGKIQPKGKLLDLSEPNCSENSDLGNPGSSEIEVIVSNPETINPETIFEEFRKNYPGTKRGLLTEFENFKKKTKNWKEILPLLNGTLLYQIQLREKKQCEGGFVPEWKNLRTWINQKCWEEEINILKNGNQRKSNKSGATDEEIARIFVKHFARDFAG